uniref:Protein-export membrane protein SecF n=1 Tax=candidate division WOR-3 bacterium TaxID=2052148 RepID=A0A7C3N4Z2_UNCW3
MNLKKINLPEINFVGTRKITYIISLVLVIGSILTILFNKGFNLGIDFTGGIVLQVHFEKDVKIEQLRDVMNSLGYKNAVIQKYGTENDFLIKVQENFEKVQDTTGPVVVGFSTYPNPTKGEKNLTVKVKVYDEKSPVKNIFIRSDIFKEIKELTPSDIYDSREEVGVLNFSLDDFKKDSLVTLYAFGVDRTKNKGLEKEIKIFVCSKNADITKVQVVSDWQDTTYKASSKGVELSPTEKIISLLKERFIEENPRVDREEVVGAIMSKELQLKSLWVVLLGLVGILIYVWIRFTFRFGVASVIALFHDVVITLGFLTITGREMSVQIIAALLTLIGYSINDSIIVSDRIRENLKLMRKDNFSTIVNKSLNQVLSRTLITSLTTLFVVFMLFLFGGKVLNDFAFALLVGVIVGTYSSDFIVAPLVLDWEIKKPSKKRG